MKEGGQSHTVSGSSETALQLRVNRNTCSRSRFTRVWHVTVNYTQACTMLVFHSVSNGARRCHLDTRTRICQKMWHPNAWYSEGGNGAQRGQIRGRGRGRGLTRLLYTLLLFLCILQCQFTTMTIPLGGEEEQEGTGICFN